MEDSFQSYFCDKSPTHNDAPEVSRMTKTARPLKYMMSPAVPLIPKANLNKEALRSGRNGRLM
jgi:hypothetical protein